MSKNVRCSECRHQMTGWDGGFFGLPLTCECRIYGETEGRKSCSKFKKRVTKSDLLNKIQSLEKENEQLKKVNNTLYNENIQLRRILVNYKDLINDVKYLEEKGVFDGKKDKKNIWDVEPVVEKHS